MDDGPGEWVDKDAYVLPVLPESLGVDPMFAALLHTAAFLEISGDEAVNPDWAVEALEHMAYYLQRLPESDIDRLNRQLYSVAEYGRKDGWAEEVVEFIETFFEACGIGDNGQ